MRRAVLDASAVLALIFGEPGGEALDEVLASGAVISAVNLAEVVSVLRQAGWSAAQTEEVVTGLGAEVIPFGGRTALMSGHLRPATRMLGLSLGDRSCLALAGELGLPAVTADQAWAQLRIPGIEVQLIR